MPGLNIGLPEVILILAIALIVLGPKRLPEVGASLGKSIREFRKAATEVQEATSLSGPAAPAPVAGAPLAPPTAPAPAAPPPPASAEAPSVAQPVSTGSPSDSSQPGV